MSTIDPPAADQPRRRGRWRRPGLDKLAVALVIASALGLSQVMEVAPPADASSAAASAIRLTPVALPPAGPAPVATHRAVHPDLAHLVGWFSANGSAAALADLDGDGLPNDACLIDSRNDRVTLTPVPPDRPGGWTAFVLDTPLNLRAAADGTLAPSVVPTGCALADLDHDGRLDVVVAFVGHPPMLFQATGDRPTVSGWRAHTLLEPGRGSGAETLLVGDFDGDGWEDLFFGGYFADGTNPFDVSGASPMRLNESLSRAVNGGRDHILRNATGDGAGGGAVRFVDVTDTLPAELGTGWAFAAGAADLTGDGLPELYIANDWGNDRLALNVSTPGRIAFQLVEGRRRLIDPRSSVLGRDSFAGMGVEFADVTGDGRLDIWVSNMAEPWGIVQSHFLWADTGDGDAAWSRGRAPFVNRAGALGLARSAWAWDGKAIDLDHDGTPELLQPTGFLAGTKNRMPELWEFAMTNDTLTADPGLWPAYHVGDRLSGQTHPRVWHRSAGQGAFTDIAGHIGLGAPTVTRGIAPGDVDGDGDMDFVLVRQWAESTLWRNDSDLGGRASLVLTLLRDNGPGRGTRPAIDAQARVTLPDGRRLVGVLDGGNGHAGRRAHQIHFGLGALAEDAKVPVTITWRSAQGPRQALLELTAGNHRLVLEDLAAAAGHAPLPHGQDEEGEG